MSVVARLENLERLAIATNPPMRIPPCTPAEEAARSAAFEAMAAKYPVSLRTLKEFTEAMETRR